MSTLKEYLAALDAKNATVIDPASRLRRTVTAINANLAKCGAEIDGQDVLSKEELAKIQLKIPQCLTESDRLARIEAFAKKTQEELKKLDVEFI